MVFPLAIFFQTFHGYFCFAFGPSISHVRLVGGNEVVRDQGRWWERRAVTLREERYAQCSMRTQEAHQLELAYYPHVSMIAALYVVLISTNSTQFTCLEPYGRMTAPLVLWGKDPFLFETIFYVLGSSTGLHRNAAEVAELHRRSWERKLLLLVAWVRVHLGSPVRQACWEACSALLCVSLYFFPHGPLCLCLTMPPELGFSFWF